MQENKRKNSMESNIGGNAEYQKRSSIRSIIASSQDPENKQRASVINLGEFL